jgi:hypothetical protein
MNLLSKSGSNERHTNFFGMHNSLK